jgi:Flp pilus assembly protein CpaB
LKKFFSAILFALIALSIAFGYKAFIEAQKSEVTVYRAKQFIEKGELIKFEMIVKDTISNDAYNDIALSDYIVGKYAKFDMPKDDIITEGKVTDTYKSENIYKANLGKDMVITGIAVNLRTSAGAIIKPGDRVNLIAITRKNGDIAQTKRILEYIKVIEIKNDKAVPTNEADKMQNTTNMVNVIPSVVSVEANKQQAIQIAAYDEFNLELCADDYQIDGGNEEYSKPIEDTVQGGLPDANSTSNGQQ